MGTGLSLFRAGSHRAARIRRPPLPRRLSVMVPPIDYFAQGTELISVRDAFLAMSDFNLGVRKPSR